MFLPYLGKKENKQVQLLHFGGLDLRESAVANTLSEAENLSTHAYPALISRKPRKKILLGANISKLIAPEYTNTPLSAFTGIQNNHFYYNGVQIGDTPLTPGEKSVVDFNGKICIFPDKLYYDYRPDPTTGTVVQALRPMERTLTLNGNTSFSSTRNSVTGAYHASVQNSTGDFSIFRPGDSLVIQGCSKEENNTCTIQGSDDFASDTAIVSVVVSEVNSNSLSLVLYNKHGEKVVFTNSTERNTITLSVPIPVMNHVCVHNNRLWGTAENGEFIYASKLGDCFNFNVFQGLSDDSWYSKIGSPGKFTGICSYRTSVVAFKQDCIHHVYGDSPKNFSIPKQTAGGCVDGRSIVELNGILYYRAANGFRSYRGGEPEDISPQLPFSCDTCVAGTDGQRYYALVTRSIYQRDLLVYDPDHGIWLREDDTPFLDFLHFGGNFYAATREGVWLFDHGLEAVSWSLTTQPLNLNTMEYKAPNCIWLRLDAAVGTQLQVSVAFDDNPFVLCTDTIIRGGHRTHRIPVRLNPCDSFRLRISGRGNAVLHAMELITYQGGKTYEA